MRMQTVRRMAAVATAAPRLRRLDRMSLIRVARLVVHDGAGHMDRHLRQSVHVARCDVCVLACCANPLARAVALALLLDGLGL